MPNNKPRYSLTVNGQQRTVEADKFNDNVTTFIDEMPDATIRMKDGDGNEKDVRLNDLSDALYQNYQYVTTDKPIYVNTKAPTPPSAKTNQPSTKATVPSKPNQEAAKSQKEEPGFFSRLSDGILNKSVEAAKAAAQVVKGINETFPTTLRDRFLGGQEAHTLAAGTALADNMRQAQQQTAIPSATEAQQPTEPTHEKVATAQDQQRAAAIRDKYGKIYAQNFDKVGEHPLTPAYMETVRAMLENGDAATQEEAMHYVFENQHAPKAMQMASEVARDVVGGMPQSVKDDEVGEALSGQWYTKAIQDRLHAGAAKMGFRSDDDYDQYVDEYVKPMLAKEIGMKYHYPKSLAEATADALFSHEGDARSKAKEYDPAALSEGERRLYAALMATFDKRLAADRQQATEKASEVSAKETAGNLAIGGREGHAMQAGTVAQERREYNAWADPSRAINYVLDKLMGGKGGQGNGGGNEDIDRRAVGNLLYRKMVEKLVAERIPQSKWGYVLKGFVDGDVGELLKNYTQTDFERWLDSVADSKYAQSLTGPTGMLAAGGHEAARFVSDAWEYYIGGKVGSAITGTMRKRAVREFAADLANRGIEKATAKAIAERTFQRTAQGAGRKAMMGMAHGAGTMGTAQAINGTLRQSVASAGGAKMDELLQRKADGEDISQQQMELETAAANKEARSLTSIVGAGAKGGLGGLVAGLSFGPGTYAGDMVSRWTSKYMGDLSSAAAGYLARLNTNAASMTALGQAEGAMTGEKPEGSIANQFAQNVVTFAMLDGQGASLRLMGRHPIKTYRAWKEYERSHNISEEDQQRMREAGYGDLIDTIDILVSRRLRDGGTNLPNDGWRPQQEVTRVNKAMMGMLADTRLPEELKRKYYELVTGDNAKQLSPIVASEVTADADGNHYLVTYNKEGDVVSDRRYPSGKAAQEAQMAIGHEQDENLTAALEHGAFAADADALMEQAYLRAAEAFKDGDGSLSEGDRTLMYLYQNKDRLEKALTAMNSGEPLSEADQRLVRLYAHISGALFGYDTNRGAIYDIARETERANGLGSHTLGRARRGHTAREAKKLAAQNGEEAIHVGGDVWRTESEDAAVKDYQQRLYDHMNGIETGREETLKEPRGIEDKSETGNTERPEPTIPPQNIAAPETGEGKKPTLDGTGDGEMAAGGERPSEAAAASGSGDEDTANLRKRRETGYDRGAGIEQDETQLAQIQQESDLANQRFNHAFADGRMDDFRNALIEAVEADDEERMERLFEQWGDKLNDEQKEASYGLIENASTQNGVDDSITSQTMAYQEQRRNELEAISDSRGLITKLTLRDGRTVYYISGDLTNNYGGIIAVDADGKALQIPVGNIQGAEEPTRAADILEADTNAFANTLRQKYKQIASGAMMLPGQEGDIVFSGQKMHVRAIGRLEDGRIQLASEDGSSIALTPEELREATTAGRRQAAAAQIEAETREREQKAKEEKLSKGIVGYADGKPDYSHKDTDAEVAGLYLREQDETAGTKGGEGLQRLQDEMDTMKGRMREAKLDLDRQRDWLDLNGDSYSPEEKAMKEKLIADREQEIADLEQRQRKLGQVRNGYMTPTERKKFRSERMRTSEQARKAAEKAAPQSKNDKAETVEGISPKELLASCATQLDAENLLESKREEIIKEYKEGAAKTMSDVDRDLREYGDGLLDLDGDELEALHAKKMAAQAAEREAMARVGQIKNAKRRLSITYKDRNKQELEQMSPAARRQSILGKARTTDELLKAAKAAYGDMPEVGELDDLEPRSLEEYVSQNLLAHSIAFDSIGTGINRKRGLGEETGMKRGVGKRFDTNGLEYYLAPKGQGWSVDEAAHHIWEDMPESMQQMYDDMDVKNELLNLFMTYTSSRAIKELTLRHRIDYLEQQMQYEEEQERWYEEQEEETVRRRQEERELYNDYLEEMLPSLVPPEEELRYADELYADEQAEEEERMRKEAEAWDQYYTWRENEGDSEETDKPTKKQKTNGTEGKRTDEGTDGRGRGMDKELDPGEKNGGNGQGETALRGEEAHQPDVASQHLGEHEAGQKPAGVAVGHSGADGGVPVQKGAQGIGASGAAEVQQHTEPGEAEKDEAERVMDEVERRKKLTDYDTLKADELSKREASEKMEAERQGVNTEPSEKQKEAGNYKKGHIKVDGYDITIENPKGSTRSGKDASGKAWSVPMHYDYGYIRGTEGVDGDHIDVYLSDNPTEGNVYVVDQVNQKDGSFDEHKVMYGFPSMEAAVEAYKGQYEKGWKVGTVTEVSREDFKKWVKSSHRKTKPFSEYKSVKEAAAEQRPTGEPKRVSAKEAALRDGLRDVMREAGIPVIDDAGEGQRVLDMANGARLDKNKKRALETASPNLNGTDHQTVVSSTLGAKVIKDLDNLVNEYEFNKGNKPNTFIGDLSRALGAQKHGSNSEYATFETKNGRVVTIRLANHNAKVSTFDNHNESDGISIVITANNNSKLTNDGNAHVTEFYYNALKLRRAEGKPLADIVRSIKQALYSGEFKDTTGLAERQEVNAGDVARQQKVYHGSANDFDHFDTMNHLAEGEGSQAFGAGTYVADQKNLGRKYAEIAFRNRHFAPGNFTVDVELDGVPIDWHSSDKPDYVRDAINAILAYGEKEAINIIKRSITGLESSPNLSSSKAVNKLKKTYELLNSGRISIIPHTPTLYTVEIPDDNGKNYLDWDGELSRKQADTIRKRLYEAVLALNDDYKGAEQYLAQDLSVIKEGSHIGDTYGTISDYLSSDKAASEFLHDLGYTGIKVHAAHNSNDARYKDNWNYVIFNDKDLKITDKVKFFRTANGEAYGFTVGGKIYYDPRIATSETPIHEYTHLWAKALRKANPKEWANVVELMKGTWAWDHVRKLYPELETDDEIAEEALAHFSGKRGAENARKAMEEAMGEDRDGGLKEAAKRGLARLREALSKFWKNVCDLLHVHFTSAEEVADKVMYDLLNKVNPNTFNLSKPVEEGRDLIAVHNLTEDKLKQSLELGGFPMPSIAITKTSMGHAGYGDISLLFGKDTINPSDRRNKVYSGDAWTPTFPQVSYKLDEKKLDDIYSRALKVGNLPFFKSIRLEPGNLRDRIDGKAPAEIIESSKKDYGMKQMFLTEKGNPVKEYVQITVDKYSPERVELLQQILDKFGVDGLKSGKYDDELKQIVGSYLHKDLDSVKPNFAKIKVQNALRDAIDFAENGNKKVDYDVEATQKEIDRRTDPKEYDQWLHEMFDGIIEKKGIRNNTDPYTRSGDRREWERLYDAVTLENVLKAMKAQPAKSGSFFSSIFGASAKELSNLNEVREEAKRRIKSVPEEEFKAEKDKILSRLEKISLPSVESSNSISGAMDFVENVKDAVVHSHSPKGIYKYLSDFYPDMTMEVANEIAGVVKDIQAMSTRYLEAKPYRAVGFDEVRAAVVPSDTETRIVQQLKDKGIAVYSYERGNTEERRQVVNDAAQEQNAKFYKAESGNSKKAAENEVEAVNKRFNEELQEQIDGQQEPGHIYQLGRPSSVLLSTGIPDLPIQLSATRLKDKATSFGHDYALEDVKGLVNALQHPLAVFADGNKEKAQNVIVELEKDGKNFIVGLSLRPVVNGRVLEINSIRNVFPKNNSEWLNWISQGKALYIDKKKVQDLIDKQRTILADVDYLDLNSVAKIINDFENPVIKGENLSREGEDQLLMDGNGISFSRVDPEEAAALDGQPTVKVYRAMQLIDGKLYPPMMAAVRGKLVEPRELGQWEVADERPDIIEKVKKNKAGEDIGYVTLDKGSKDATGKKGTPVRNVAYNPYWHTSRSPLNDQFKSAWIRPNIVTVEVEVPVSELTSGYKAKYAKDSVGETDWHSGSVTKQLTSQGHAARKVILSRYDKPVRILSAAETAERIADYIKGYDVTIPENVVTPQVRVELEKRGVRIGPPERGVRKTDQIREAIEKGLSVTMDLGDEASKAAGTQRQTEADSVMRRRGGTVKERSEAELEEIGKAAEALGETLGGVPVTIERNGKDGIKGSYNTEDGSVHVNLDEADGIEDIEGTVAHEVLGHEGLKALLGSNRAVDAFGQFIYDNASKDLRRRIVERAADEGYEWTDEKRHSKAAQEVFADIAAEGPATEAEFSLWRKVKHYLIRAMKKLGIRIRGILNDKDLRYYVLKTGSALKRWDRMGAEERTEAAESGRVMYSRSVQPRRKTGESDAQYIQRLRNIAQWKQAKERAEANHDPLPEKEDFDRRAQEDFDRAMDEWRRKNGIAFDAKMPTEFPKRKEGESPQDYAIRVADYEAQSDLWKGAPNVFDYMAKAQEEYRKAYEAWKTRYDIHEMESVDEKLYSGEPISGTHPQTDEQHYDQLEVEHAVERDAERELGDAVGMDLSADGARHHAKLAVIERRKNLESASVEDAIFIHDLCKEIDALAKEMGMKPKDLRRRLIHIIERPVGQQEAEAEVRRWVDILNKMRAIEDAHTFITADGVKAAKEELTELGRVMGEQGEKPATEEGRKALHEAATRLATKLNDYYSHQPPLGQTEEGDGGQGTTPADWNPIYGDDILQVGKYINKLAEALKEADSADNLSEDPRVKAITDKIHDWYDNFYHLIEDAGLRGDAGYIANGYINHIWDKAKSDAGAWSKYVENYQRTKSQNMRHREIATYLDGIAVGLVPKFTDVAKIMSYYSRQNNEAIANKKFLDDLSFLTISELNSDGEVVRTLPVLNSHHPSRFDEERYLMYHVPGVGDVWVLKDVARRFASIFGTMRTQDIPDWLSKIGKGYDLLASTMKKIQLSISGFHMGALSEVALAQMRPDRGMKAIFKYILLDSIRNHGEIPAYAHPDDFKFAASHLVQLGATQDYAAADVNMITEKFRNYVKGLRKDEAFVKQAAGGTLTPLAVSLDMINKGMDKLLWNYLHDGLKIACFKQFAEQIDRRVEKEGLTAEQRERLLDEAGQYVNDTFGGQYWELLNVSPATLKWLRRAFLSPDWLISTQRHFFANFGFGSLYDPRGFSQYLKDQLPGGKNRRAKREADAGQPMKPEDDGDIYRKFRSKEARLCYVLGVCVFFYSMMNGLNAVMKARDEEKEKEKADEIRKTNPDYKSPYELAYPDGMKWYDYTMFGNSLGQQTHLFLGRYADGSEMYVRWGKQFREFPEMFIGRKGLDFPAPMIQRMMGKANPVIGLVRDNLGALGIWGFENSNDIEEIQAKYGKTIGLLAMNARHFLPFSLPTQADKEFKMMDLFMPSSKGFTRYKTVDYFKDFIKAGDMEGVGRVYRAATMNGIDVEKCLNAAISTLEAEQREEMRDGITDLGGAVAAYDRARTLKEKKAIRGKMLKLLAAENYKAFSRDEALEQVEDYLSGKDMAEKTKDNDRYIGLSTSADVREDYRLSAIGKQARKFSAQIKAAQENGDAATANKLASRYRAWIEIDQIARQEKSAVGKLKRQLGKGDDRAVMEEIRRVRREAQRAIDQVEAPR